MSRRDFEAANAPPPTYDPNNHLFTLCLNYGGKFRHRNGSLYIGGKKVALDYVHKDVFTLQVLKTLVRSEGVKQTVRFYRLEGDGFILLKDDIDLTRMYESKLESGRLVELYVDEMKGTETLVERETSHGYVFNEEGSEESEDYDYEINDVNCEDYDLEDDKWFAENVDLHAEWYGAVQNDECDNLMVARLESDQSIEQDIVKSDVDLDSGKDSDDEKIVEKCPMFNTSQVYDPSFQIGMKFLNKDLLRKAIHSFAIKTRRTIKIVKNDKMRVHAKCADKKCKWALHGLNVPGEPTFQIRLFSDIHTCKKSFKVKNMSAKWIAGKYLHKFQSDPKRDVNGFRVETIMETKCDISPYQAYRAKRQAIDTIAGECSEQYTFLWDFAEEVRRSNPESTVIVSSYEDENGDDRFDRFYMCLDALKKGFLSGCRPILGIDGCHLKGPHSGVLLTAVGVDPNNNPYPLAIAVVQSESRDTWEWFLTLLKVDLRIVDDLSWTFMSDKQKGLISAVQEVFPKASHRFCVRHLHENFKKAGFKGDDLKCALWKAAKATTKNQIERGMEEMKVLNEAAFDWLKTKPPEQWSRAYFNGNPRCDMLLNNGCETFNGCILQAREKPIVSMLEWIFEYLMKRMQQNRDEAKTKWTGSICPNIQNIIDEGNDALGDFIPIKADAYHYQINGLDSSQYAVDIEEGTCGCRRWDLTAVPCKHALSAFNNEGYDYYDYTHQCYRIDTYKMVYGHVIMPINGRNEWRQTGFKPLSPPNNGRDVGRPETSRKRAADEPSHKGKKRSKCKPQVLSNQHRLRRQQTTIVCGMCGGEGHNKKYCPELQSIEGQQVTTETNPLDQEQNHQVATKTDALEQQQNEQEEMFVSQYRVSQASEYGDNSNLCGDLGSSNGLTKLKVKKKGCQSPPTKSGKCFKTPPKPFNQMRQGQVETGKKKKKFISLSELK